MLANLLTNAISHTPDGGTVSVTVTSAARQATIEVTDTGAGISEEHLPHVFERFYRADASRRRIDGSGIGLTISRAIVRQHDGELTAASPGQGAGTTLTMRLPATPQHGATPVERGRIP